MKDALRPKAIHQKHMPHGPPLASSVMWATAAHYWGIPQWAWGVFFCLAAFMWIYWLTWSFTHESIDFDRDTTSEEPLAPGTTTKVATVSKR